MSTRSLIVLPNKEDSEQFKAIYCHWDGYPSNMLNVLSDNYNTEEAIEALIAMGDASSINPTLEESVFYHRENGEPLNIRTGLHSSEKRRMASNSGCQYVYTFNREEKTWYFFQV
jgi:hypothetical protein